MASSIIVCKVGKVVLHNSNTSTRIHLRKEAQVSVLQMIVYKVFKINNSIILIRKNIRGGRVGIRGPQGGQRS